MSKVPAERKVAIAFIMAFREYLDHTVKPSSSPSSLTEQQASTAIQMFFGDDIEMPPDLATKVKTICQSISGDLTASVANSYERLLPETIVEAISDLESHMSSKYTAEELAELMDIVSRPSVKKLIADQAAFAALRKHKNLLITRIEEGLMDFMESHEIKKRLENSVRDLFPRGNDADNHGIDGHPLDPNDIF